MKAPGFSRIHPKTLLSVAVYLVIFAVGFQYAYYKIFSSFKPFDDEGTMMHLVSMFLKDTSSYDFLRTVYGPFYFLHKYAIHSVLQTDVSHDITRFTTIGLWGLIAVVGAYFVHRTTQSLLLAAVVQMQLILHLGPLVGSPGHPQEIALLLIMGALLLSSLVGIKHYGMLGLVGLGVAAGALILTKVNVGLFLGIPLALSMLCFLPRNFLVRALSWVAVVAALLLPAVMMWRHVQVASPEQNYCLVIIFSLAACLLVSWRRTGSAMLSWRDVCIAAAGFGFLIVCICLVIVSLGGSIGAIADAVILRALGFSGGYHTTLGIRQISVYASVVSMVLAACYCLLAPKVHNRELWILVFALIKLIYGCIALYYVYRFSMFVLLVLIPIQFMWIILIDSDGTKGTLNHRFPRVFLCLLAGFQALQAYPISGAQASWSGILLIPLAAICIGDAFPVLWTKIRRRLPERSSGLLGKEFQAAFFAITLCAVCILYYNKADIKKFEKRYTQGYALEMPGASRVHLSKREATKLKNLVRDIRSKCDGFVSLPGFSSLYFWTQIRPPGNIVAAWMISMEDERQIEIIEVMESYRRPCVIHNRRAMNTWVKRKLDYSKRPLVEYISNQFEESRSYGGYSLHVKNERAVSEPEDGSGS
jgi:hypothetical protein